MINDIEKDIVIECSEWAVKALIKISYDIDGYGDFNHLDYEVLTYENIDGDPSSKDILREVMDRDLDENMIANLIYKEEGMDNLHVDLDEKYGVKRYEL